MSDPYNANLRTDTPAPVDPFEASLTTLTQRVEALKNVKLLRGQLDQTRERTTRALRNAEHALAAAERFAEEIGAYSVAPEFRPMAKKFAGGAS